MKPDYVASSASPLDEKTKPEVTRAFPAERPVIGEASVTAGETAPKYDRNKAHRVYMREYMRKRRAADKARKEGLA